VGLGVAASEVFQNAAETGSEGANGPSCEPGTESRGVANDSRNDADRDAAIQLAKEAKKRGGLSADEAEALVELGNSVGLPSRGPESHPNRTVGKDPHVHVGPIGHIPIR